MVVNRRVRSEEFSRRGRLPRPVGERKPPDSVIVMKPRSGGY